MGIFRTTGRCLKSVERGLHTLDGLLIAADTATPALIAKAAELSATTAKECQATCKKAGCEKEYNSAYSAAMAEWK